MQLSFLFVLAAIQNCIWEIPKPTVDSLEEKTQEDKVDDSNEEEDSEDCPVAEITILEKTTDLL